MFVSSPHTGCLRTVPLTPGASQGPTLPLLPAQETLGQRIYNVRCSLQPEWE